MVPVNACPINRNIEFERKQYTNLKMPEIPAINLFHFYDDPDNPTQYSKYVRKGLYLTRVA